MTLPPPSRSSRLGFSPSAAIIRRRQHRRAKSFDLQGNDSFLPLSRGSAREGEVNFEIPISLSCARERTNEPGANPFPVALYARVCVRMQEQPGLRDFKYARRGKCNVGCSRRIIPLRCNRYEARARVFSLGATLTKGSPLFPSLSNKRTKRGTKRKICTSSSIPCTYVYVRAGATLALPEYIRGSACTRGEGSSSRLHPATEKSSARTHTYTGSRARGPAEGIQEGGGTGCRIFSAPRAY